MKRESLAVWLIISSFSIPLLIIPSLKAQSQWLSTNSNGSTSVAPVVITFNTGTTTALFHDLPPDDGYTSEHAEISDEWYGNGLAWVPAVDATRDFIAQVDPDVVVFQEIFHSEECADIPPEAREDFVCEDWMPGDPTVTQTVLGEDFQIACHLDKPDKCAGVHRRFGRFRGCDSDLCLDGLDGTEIPGCGSGARVGSGVIDLVTGGSITLVNIHGTSGINQDDTDCRVQQFEQVFVDLGDGEPGANGAVNLVMGDLNVDPGRLDGIEASATRFNDFVGDDNPFQYISYFGPDAPRTYLGLWTIDYVVSDTFDGSCQVPGVTPGVPDVIDAVYFDHKPVVCELEGVSPEDMVTGDMDGNGQDEVIIDFGDGGIWVRLNNSSWFQLDALSPENMAVGKLD